MKPTRRLALSKETLVDLSPDDLLAVTGGVSGVTCVTRFTACQPSELVATTCGFTDNCPTGFCSVDVC